MSMNQLGIWLNDKEYLCDLNEHTTCDEVIQLLIKPPMNETPHSCEINACEYKLDKLFAKQSDSSNNSNSSMDEQRQSHIPRKSRLDIVYDNRIKELSERINLLDSAIEIYDNTDVEDGLTDDEIIENQITRMGMLLKKQSTAIKNVSNQQSISLYREITTNEQLLAELEKTCDKMKMFDDQLQELQSTLDVLNWRSNKYEMKPEQYSNMRTKHRDLSCPSRLPKQTKVQFTSDYESNHRKDIPLLNNTSYKSKHESNDMDIIDSNEEEISKRKEIISLTFDLEDEESSILV